MMTVPPDLQLASKSPRRRELLDQIGVRYCVVPANIDEAVSEGETPTQLVQRLAEQKAAAGYAASPVRPTLGSDTIVVCDDVVFGKPVDRVDSMRMLQALSDRKHFVLSAVSIMDGVRQASTVSASEVTFRQLSNAEIALYWDTGEPCDKAGSYGVQGMGAVFVASLNGSYSGVMGLPIAETAKLLREFNIPYWQDCAELTQ